MRNPPNGFCFFLSTQKEDNINVLTFLHILYTIVLKEARVPKFTYPIVFILNPETGAYNGFIPDLLIFAEGEQLESVYENAQEILQKFFELQTKYQKEVPGPSTLDDISAKWSGYKVSLVTANVS